ncbi:MATH and LRR domain-containing protein PFE0570w-like isoform X4 [Ostrea edulis]|uniref:MATH and LRR domain-containing protein PFE0570w-like isoform X4 n=1 Tax=Ostrea edulis TaxID=37623 RepID=UPI0024AEF34C|nr:MATH and LRR domain-containing protein PFE0570w-like isoform X4 [Ostrea edulis]
MVIFRHLLVLELYLYAGVLIKALLTSTIDGDYTVYNEVTSFDTTLRILDEIRDKQCLPCFTYTKNWKGPQLFTQFSTSDDQEICRQIKCSFQGRCLRFGNKDSCYSWTITVILEKEKYVLFSRTNPSSNEKTNLNISCYDTGIPRKRECKKNCNDMKDKRECKKKCSHIKVNTAITTSTEISTTVSKEFRLKTSTSDKELTDKERSDDVNDSSNDDDDDNDDGGDSNDNDDDDVDRDNGNDDDDYDKATETGNKDNLDRKCRKNCKQCRRCSGNKNLNDCVNTGNQKKCPECTSIGILFITHVIAAGIGAGILYFIQFIKEYRRKRTKEPKPKSNKDMINASYGHTRGTAILQTSNISHQEEGIYNEVDDKPESVLFDNTGSNCSTGSALNDRKHAKLPDIPHQYDRYEECLLPQNPKDLLLSDTHIHSLEKVKTSTSSLQEELLLKDVNELNQETKRDNILQDTYVADSGHDDYFVLQKADNMNLK